MRFQEPSKGPQHCMLGQVDKSELVANHRIVSAPVSYCTFSDTPGRTVIKYIAISNAIVSVPSLNSVDQGENRIPGVHAWRGQPSWYRSADSGDGGSSHLPDSTLFVTLIDSEQCAVKRRQTVEKPFDLK